MAKPLVFEFKGKPVHLAHRKIDRSKLYGYVDVEVQDESGKPCELGTLLGDGHSLVGKGGTGLAYLSPEGLWRKKADLLPVDFHGRQITPVKSTFDTVVKLDDSTRADVDDYLAHNINLIYHLVPHEDGVLDGHDALLAELRAGALHKFPFSYRGGVSANAGFLLIGSDGNLFLCVGIATAIDYIGLKATAPTIQEEAAEPAEEDDSLDFSLV